MTTFKTEQVVRVALAALTSRAGLELYSMLVDSKLILEKVEPENVISGTAKPNPANAEIKNDYKLLPAYENLFVAVERLILSHFLIGALTRIVDDRAYIDIVIPGGFELHAKNKMGEHLTDFLNTDLPTLIKSTLSHGNTMAYLNFLVPGTPVNYGTHYKVQMANTVAHMAMQLKDLPVGEPGSRAAFIGTLITALNKSKAEANDSIARSLGEISGRVQQTRVARVAWWKTQKQVLMGRQWKEAGIPPEWKELSPEEIVNALDEVELSSANAPELIAAVVATNDEDLLARTLVHGDPRRSAIHVKAFAREGSTAGEMVIERRDAPEVDKPATEKTRALLLAAVRAEDNRRILLQGSDAVRAVPKLGNTLLDALTRYEKALNPDGEGYRLRIKDVKKIKALCESEVLNKLEAPALVQALDAILNDLTFRVRVQLLGVNLWSNTARRMDSRLIQGIATALLQHGYRLTLADEKKDASATFSSDLSNSEPPIQRFYISKWATPPQSGLVEGVSLTVTLPWLNAVFKPEAPLTKEAQACLTM